MSSLSAQAKPTIAFFGATGGCGLAVLARSLEAGIECTALVRTPSKLLSLLSARSTPTTTLSVITGSIHDVSAVRQTLTRPSTSNSSNNNNNATVDIIINSTGGTPRFQASLLKPVTLDDPTICATGTETILTALRTMQAESNPPSAGERTLQKPLLFAVSTTGIEPKQRDVPLLFAPLYHWLLAVPHADKKAMEDLLREQFPPSTSNSTTNVLSGALLIRPSLLLDGPAAPLRKQGEAKGLRVGLGAGRAEVGYTITRESVGAWVFEGGVCGGDGGSGGWGKWNGGCAVVTLTE